MKKKVFLSLVLLLMSISLTGCNKKEISEYKVNIPEVLTVETLADTDTKLGSLEKNKVVAVIRRGAFENIQKVQIVTPENMPAQKDVILAGSPIKISVEGKDAVRFDEAAAITMAFDKSKILESIDKSFLRVGYYNGKNWEYIKPSDVDMEKGIMTFNTYHFSLFSPQISDKTKITEQFIHSQALDNVIRDNTNNESDYMTQQVVAMTLAKMGITDVKMQEKIFEKVAEAENYKEIYDLYQRGDTEGAAQKTALLAGTAIVKSVPTSMLKDALGGVIGAADDIAKVSKAAGYAAEGKYKDAAKIIGEQIADKFLITTAGKIAVEIIDGQINSWKNSEVEAAYKAYKNGADGYFWGYNVDKGDFDGIWSQMRGINRQLELEAIKKENEIRLEAGMDKLSEKETVMVRARIKQQYKKQFKVREKKEVEIKKEEDKLKMLFEAFNEKKVFSEGIGPKTLNKKGYTYEQKLELMHHFAKKMMEDTGRNELTEGFTGISDKKISTVQIIIAAKKYFSEPDGKKKYAEYIKEEFDVGKYPTIEELNGDLGGVVTITDIKMSDEFKQKLKKGEGPEGCDMAALEEMKGSENDMNFNFKQKDKHSGQITMQSDGMTDGKPMLFTYYNGKIEVTIIDDKANGKMFFDAIKKDDGTIELGGNMYVEYMGGDISIKADIAAQK